MVFAIDIIFITCAISLIYEQNKDDLCIKPQFNLLRCGPFVSSIVFFFITCLIEGLILRQKKE
jgi:hypothetical protein